MWQPTQPLCLKNSVLARCNRAMLFSTDLRASIEATGRVTLESAETRRATTSARAGVELLGPVERGLPARLFMKDPLLASAEG